MTATTSAQSPARPRAVLPHEADWADLPLAAAREAVAVLAAEAHRDWSDLAGETDRTARETLDHTVLAVMGYAGLLIARPTDRYLALRTGNEPSAPVEHCLESLTIASTVLSYVVAATPPEVRAHHSWGDSDASGFSAMGMTEILVHTHDILRSWGSAWLPPDQLAQPVLDRLFPHAPEGHAAGRTLLWATGRVALGDLAQLPPGRWQWYGAVR